ncbi:MAG: hypothetical protein NDI60_05610 [Elusimicrobiales bacterium]|nr:hypothetical protein [Elusimicrobiales bacterium]
MNGDPFLPLFGLAGGLVLLAIGFLKRYKAGRLAAYTRVPTGQLRPAERQLISGPAFGLGPLTAPVSKRQCIFYLEKSERLQVSHGRRGGSRTSWVPAGMTARGGFRVDDGSGGVLVFPTAASPDFSRPAFDDGNTALLAADGAVRQTEQVLLEGDNVTVIGTPVTLTEVLAAARGGSEFNIPTELMASLVKLEREGGAATPCFFGSGAETVADLAYADYAADVSATARLLLQAGGMLAVLSAAALLYSLAGGGPAQGDVNF